ISFKNFRRFADFPEFKFGDITILVGGNNAGKSTLQKALLLVFDNLRTLKKKPSAFNIFDDGFDCPQFRFDANEIHDLNLGTFERSLYDGAETPHMQFSLRIDSFDITLTIEPDEVGPDFPVAKVAKIHVDDTKRHILYDFDFNTRRMRVEFEKINGNGDPKFDEIQSRISELRNQLAIEDDPFEAAMANQELEKLLKVRNAFVDNREELQESAIAEADINNYLGIKAENRVTSGALAGYIENIEAYTWTIGSVAEKAIDLDGNNSENESEPEGKELYNGTEEDRANEQVLGDKNSLLLESARALQSELRKPHVYYIQAHGVAQKMLYTIDDKNDFVAQAIHQYARCGIKPGQVPDTFIKRWMQEFGIGDEYEVKPIGGEGYQVFITSNGRKTNLADMGMGTNQLMVLLFSLATIMFEEGHHGKDGGRSYIPKFIIIEEPEQNLHPRLQSKLADLILEVTKDPSYKFLIETHSEYLIRRTQVLVAEMGLEETDLEKQNPFKVYYFPENGIPYDMKYLTSGRFENKFGNGFFDEASNSALTISKLERKKTNV
ncbi:MAG: ATP-binding protein, partial [Muribaculum sp.]|nr:ATP-binding protein [Muribaculum sp.]